MHKFQIVMCKFLLAFTLTGCTQSNNDLNSTSTNALASKASEEPGSSTIVSTPPSTPDLSSTKNKNKLEPASTTEPSINPITNNDNSDDSNSNAKDITSLIPTGWNILNVNYENAKAKAEGDLNKDGIQDIAIVIENTADINDRSLLIAFGTKDNTYSLSIIADKVILGALEGGGWGDPFDGIIIDRGSVVVNDYGGSGQRWYDNYRFRFQENDWYLIGVTMGWNHPIKEGTEMAFDTEDYNLLTGDYIFEKIEENGEEKITKGNRGKKKLVKLSDFNIDDM